MNNDVIKNKIKKLFALSKSPNEHEAMAALEKAEQLLKEYSLSKDDVLITQQEVKGTVRLSSWRAVIIDAINWLNGTVSVRTSDGKYIFYGSDIAVTMSAEMFKYLEKSIERIARQSIRKNAKLPYRNAFKYGAAKNIHVRIHDMGKNVRWFDREERSKVLWAYIKGKLSVKSEKVTVSALSNKAYTKGFDAGNAIHLNRQANGSKIQQLAE